MSLENLKSKISSLQLSFNSQNIYSSFSKIVEQFSSVVFSSSFGIEDQLITYLIFKSKLPIKIFGIDTGRLFEETYTLIEETKLKYSLPIEMFYPSQNSVEKFVNTKGINGFFYSVENRKECCHIRKVEPLDRALEGSELWITGIRKEHSENRTNMNFIEVDESRGIAKFHPLFFLTQEEVNKEIKKSHIPYNPLHDKSFPSIGCAPCTRAVREGEHFRAGRWWWEKESQKECGLHQ